MSGLVCAMAAIGQLEMRTGRQTTQGAWSHLPRWQAEGQYWQVARSHYTHRRPPSLPRELPAECSNQTGSTVSDRCCHHVGHSMQCALDDPLAQVDNQEILRRHLPKVRVARTARGDLGLLAAEEIQKGQLVTHYAGLVMCRREAEEKMVWHKETGMVSYLMRVTDEVYVDAEVLGSEARFLDHHCSGNLLSEVVWVGGDDPEPLLCFTAKRQIVTGSFLSYHYNCDKEESNWPFRCDCWAPNCVRKGSKQKRVVNTTKRKAGAPEPGPAGLAPTEKKQRGETAERVCWSCKEESGCAGPARRRQ
eukprot:1253962-Rhodomonas_salina.3